MRQILHAFQLRLTNLSQGNRALKLGRLSPRRDLDWRELAFLDEKSAEDLLATLMAGKSVPLIRQIDPRHEPTNLMDRRLTRVFRSVQQLLAESGSYDLALGFPFVEGKFLDGIVVRCPLLLFPVTLERQLQGSPRWKLTLAQEAVTFNPTFLLAYEQFQSWRFPAAIWEEELEPRPDWTAWVQQLYEKVKGYEIQVNFNSDLFHKQLESWTDLRREDMDLWKTGVMKLRPQAILGLFPQSDSTLLQDYDEIALRPGEFDVERFLSGEAAVQPDPKPIREEDRYFALPVDASQEEALLSVKRGSSLVLHGPPGTGKSQVIVNLITDALAHGKRVLVVSQKRAALDVVYKRLDGLGISRFAMLVHDHRHDRAAMYQKIHRQIQDLEAFKASFRDLTQTAAEHEYRRLSREIDSQTQQLEELARALQDRSRFGLSPHELYSLSSPHRPWLPLDDTARKLQYSSLLRWLDQMRAIRSYREFFDAAYPWKHRLSFRHYQWQDQQRISGELGQLAGQLARFQEQRQALMPDMGPNLLDIAANRQATAHFRRLDRFHKRLDLRQGLQNLELDEQRPAAVAKALEACNKHLSRLDRLSLFNDDSWRHFEELNQHLESWKAHHHQPLRWFQLRYLKARWFLFRYLEGMGKSGEESLVQALGKEMKQVNALHAWYVQQHGWAFFADFPLLEPQSEKRRWVEQKQEQLAAWKEIREKEPFPPLRPRLEQGIWLDAEWAHSLSRIAALERFTDALEEAQRGWRLWLHPRQMEQLAAAINADSPTGGLAGSLKTSFDSDFIDLQALDRLLAELDLNGQQLLDQVETGLTGEPTEAAFTDLLANSVYLTWIQAIEEAQPVLLQVSSRGWDRMLESYREKYQQRQPEVARLVLRRLKEQAVEELEFNRLKNRVTYRDIEHQVSKKRNLWPVRRLVSETWHTGLQRLAPCWLASPEAVAAMFPMEKDLFDLVIFDEASQCFVERALPVMLRGRQVVIAGDDKQLPPLDLYRVRLEEDLPDSTEAMPLEVQSILDLARKTLPAAKLRWHYRSQSEALIRFSNERFYENSHRMMPLARPEPLHQPPLVWDAVEGSWEDQRNEPEAKRVLAWLETLARRSDRPSVGVVTFNFHQQELILDLLEQRMSELAAADPGLFRAMTDLMQRVAGEEQQGLFVKNIENVQGDERDVIVFSIGYARDKSGKLQTRFGLLNQAGGENRLNVAVTRARWQMVVVCSFQPEELRVEQSTHAGPGMFRDWLQYAWAQGQIRGPLQLRPEIAAGGGLAARLLPGILAAGYVADDPAVMGSDQLDLAIRRSGESDYLLGLEAEGPRYFGGLSAKERELYRPGMLRDRQWRWIRIWARNLWQDPERELRRVLEAMS